jgi:BirA family biotin operon repressor/biotin-[acetyl-CoA-carboxylase] ligase
METSAGIINPWGGAPVWVRERTLSTMDDARELARAGCPSGTVVVAGYQEKGRGRVPGRVWSSAPGESLLATVVVNLADAAFPLPQLPLRAGVAAALAVEASAGVAPRIKWPNDLVFDGRKFAGLLCEANADSVLIGVGMNLSQTAFPPELADSACSLLQASGRVVARLPLLASLLARLKDIMTDNAWREKLQARLHARGRQVSVDLLGSGRRASGILSDVDEQGRLVLLRGDGRLQRIEQGELRTD